MAPAHAAPGPKVPDPPAPKLAISSDGAYVPLVGGEWAEVKTLAIGEVELVETEAGVKVQTNTISYFSRLTDAQTFGDLALAETQRRGVERATRVCAVQAAREAGTELPATWLKDQLHRLKHQGPTALLADLRALRAKHPEVEVIADELAYLEKREAQMQYPMYQQQGWPIGSGMVESANKQVMQTRLKGPGMHWARPHVNPMLALRTAECNDRGPEASLLIACISAPSFASSGKNSVLLSLPLRIVLLPLIPGDGLFSSVCHIRPLPLLCSQKMTHTHRVPGKASEWRSLCVFRTFSLEECS